MSLIVSTLKPPSERFACPCLNVQLQVEAHTTTADPLPPIKNGFHLPEITAPSEEEPTLPQRLQEFVEKHNFRPVNLQMDGSHSNKSAFWLTVAVGRLTERVDIEGGWQSLRCLCCDVDVVLLFGSWPRVYMNNKCLNLVQVSSAKCSSAYFSPAFDLLITIDDSDNDKGRASTTEIGKMNGYMNNNSHREASEQEIQAKCSNYLRKCQEEMDDRIRVYIDNEQRKFEEIRHKTKTERDELLRRLRENAGSGGGETAMRSTEQRQRSGGDDSAVPLSPISVLSSVGGGEPSPGGGVPPASILLPPSTTRQRTHTQPPPSQMRAQRLHSVPEPLNSGGEVAALQTGLLMRNGYSCEDAVFSLDEETFADEEFGTAGGYADDEADTDDSGTGDDYYSRYEQRRNNHQSTQPKGVTMTAAPGAGLLVSKFGTSLPVKIPIRRYWPPPEAKDSLPASNSSSDDNSPSRVRNVHEEMRELARSIQAADDPERLFGERPRRQRYHTGDTQQQQQQQRSRHGGGNRLQSRLVTAPDVIAADL